MKSIIFYEVEDVLNSSINLGSLETPTNEDNVYDYKDIKRINDTTTKEVRTKEVKRGSKEGIVATLMFEEMGIKVEVS